MATRDEVLRLVVQTAGDSDLKALSDAVTGVGTAAGISDPEVKKLVDELVSLNQTSKAVYQLTALNAQLDTNSQKLEAAIPKRRHSRRSGDKGPTGGGAPGTPPTTPG